MDPPVGFWVKYATKLSTVQYMRQLSLPPSSPHPLGTLLTPPPSLYTPSAGTPSHHIFNLMKLKFSNSGFSDREKSGQLEHDVTPHFPLLVKLQLFLIFFLQKCLQFYKERKPFFVNIRNNSSGWNQPRAKLSRFGNNVVYME